MASIVDMHAHYMSPALLDEAERNGEHYGVRLERNADGNARISFNGPAVAAVLSRALRSRTSACRHGRRRYRPPDRLDMDRHGWRRSPPLQGARWARLQNETMATDIKAYPGRFAAMGTLPTQDVGAAIAELDYMVDHLGIRSVEIGTNINGRDLDHPDFRPLWKRLHERNIFVFLHPPLRPIGPDRTGDYFLDHLISYPTDTTIAAARLIFSGLLDEYPGLKICLAHSGGFLPFQIGRFDLGYAKHPACSKVLRHQPSDFLTTFFYDSLTHNSRALSFLIDTVGATTWCTAPIIRSRWSRRWGRIASKCCRASRVRRATIFSVTRCGRC